MAQVADEDAKKSAEVVRQAVEAMDAIAKSSQQIGQIIGVIDEIAFQTNLLALNAGVEAARAGRRGPRLRRRRLGSARARAAFGRSGQGDQGPDLGFDGAGRSRRQAGGETGRSLERIMAQVAEINAVVAEIAAGAKEQATALAEVNTAINQMDQMTQQNAAMVEQSTAATHSLSQETAQLSGLIGQFQLGQTRATTRCAANCKRPRRTRSGSRPKTHLRKRPDRRTTDEHGAQSESPRPVRRSASGASLSFSP